MADANAKMENIMKIISSSSAWDDTVQQYQMMSKQTRFTNGIKFTILIKMNKY